MGSNISRRYAASLMVAVVVASLATAAPAEAARPKCAGKRATKVGTNGDDLIQGTKRADVIVARGGDDSIFGLGGNDIICGNRGADIIFGGPGKDVLLGGADNDGMAGDAGNDVFRGGAGEGDFVAFFSAPGPITLDLTRATARGQGSDRVFGVESASGGPFDDLLIGDSKGNSFFGGAGNDRIDGGLGADGLSGEEGDDVLNGGGDVDLGFYLGTDGPVDANLDTGVATGPTVGRDELDSIEGVTGGNGNDVLTASRNEDLTFFLGGPGDDRLIGGPNIEVGFFIFAAEGVRVDLAAGTATGDGNDTLTNVDGAFGTPAADELLGDDNPNLFIGGDGNDTIEGLGGDDWLNGNAGDDIITGGPGAYDLVDFSASGVGVSIDLPSGTATGEGTDRLAGIEAAMGSGFDDVFLGDALANFFFGLEGADRIDGGEGDDAFDGGPGIDVLIGGLGTDQCGPDDFAPAPPDQRETCEGTGTPPVHPLADDVEKAARLKFQ